MWGRWFIIALMFWSGAAAADEVSKVNAAITSSIRWEKHWFGQSFGSSCVRKRFEQGSTLTVYITDSRRLRDEDGLPFAAYVEGSNVMYAGRIWRSKAIVAPSMGSAGACAPGEIAPYVKKLPQDAEPVVKGPFQLSSDVSEMTATQEQAAKVEAIVARSFKSYFSQRGVGVSHRLLLGKYSLNDPYLIVLNDEDDHLYTLEFPPLDLISDRSILHVYNGGAFLGPDATPAEQKRSNERALSRIRKESKLIQ